MVQTANSLEVSSVVSGLSTKMTAAEQAYHIGQAWEALPDPKRQFTFYVIMPDGDAQSFHIGPHAPTLQGEDVQLVHRLWLNFRRDPGMQYLHHTDIVTYALTRLASEYARDKVETLKDLRRYTQDGRRRTICLRICLKLQQARHPDTQFPLRSRRAPLQRRMNKIS